MTTNFHGLEISHNEKGIITWSSDWEAVYQLYKQGKLYVRIGGPNTYGHVDYVLPTQGMPKDVRSYGQWRPVSPVLADDSGALTLPYALIGLAGYLIYWMIAHGVFQALSALGGAR